MSNYDHRLNITIPPELLLIGKSISRALDNDVGGWDSWTPVTDGETIVAYVADTPCTAGFYEQALAMLDNPAMLHYAVTADYAARWADLEPPSLAECVVFCAGVTTDAEQEQI